MVNGRREWMLDHDTSAYWAVQHCPSRPISLDALVRIGAVGAKTVWRCGYCSSGPYAGPSRGYCKQRCADLDRKFLESPESLHENVRAAIKEWLEWFEAGLRDSNDPD